MEHVSSLSLLQTPAAIVDRDKLQRNCDRMTVRAQTHRINLRPHLKTTKAAKIAEIATKQHFGGITVSTVAEAFYFNAHGFQDITYAVGLAPHKLPALAALQKEGAHINILIDEVAAIHAIDEAARNLQSTFPVFIEVDSGERRGGVSPDGQQLLDVAAGIVNSNSLTIAGVLTHAGHSYTGTTTDEIVEIAEQERSGAVLAATRLRGMGFDCQTVSIGSTPSVSHAASFEGVTEIRPGVYIFGDMQQVALGTCGIDDVAYSVLATVIGHNHGARRILVDAGSLALSKDGGRGPGANLPTYGRVATVDGRILPGLYLSTLYQEHGLIASKWEEPPYDSLPIGHKVRLLPNHSCLSAASFDEYFVVQNGSQITEIWDKTRGW
jgi:D-serine deaminase-like pyridoxal phosphate-dependent protein